MLVKRRDLKEKDSVVKGKSYNRQYVWGQLNFWERQTIAQPDASLMAARYGPVVLPDADCCFNTQLNPYSRKQRSNMLEIFENKPHSQWKTTTHWRFRNKYSIFGSPFVDAAYKKSKQGFENRLNTTLPPTMPNVSVTSKTVDGAGTSDKSTVMNNVNDVVDDVPCNICGLTGDTQENPALLCETCVTGCAHIQCLNLKTVPSGDWYCAPCEKKKLLSIPKWLHEIKKFDESMIEAVESTNVKEGAAYEQTSSKKRPVTSDGKVGSSSNGTILKLKKQKTSSSSKKKSKEKKSEKVEEDDKPCNICGLTGSTVWNPALLCDGCEYGCAHLDCLNLQRVPRKDWYCDLCR